MKKNEFVIIKGLDIKELIVKAKTLKKEIAELTLDKNRNILKDLKSIDKKRKEVAEVLTVLSQKQALALLEPKVEQRKEAVEVKEIKKKRSKKTWKAE